MGTALAEASGDAIFDAAIVDGVGRDAYSTGFARGDVKVSGSNVKFGGTIAGTATINSRTTLDSTLIGEGSTAEDLTLNARRDISFEGESRIEGIVNGAESGESSLAINPLAPRRTTIDIETTSEMNGMARALNRHDNAQVNLLVNSRTGTNGVEAIADNAVYGQAVTTRDSLGSSNEKAEASGYITDAAWTASTALLDDGSTTPIDATYRYASVQGRLGGTPDGLPEPLPGLGVGSWILNPYINPMRSQTWSTQLAATGPILLTGLAPSDFTPTANALNPLGPVLVNPLTTRVNLATYRMRLNGMVVSGNTNDAVGAYLGLDTQRLTNVRRFDETTGLLLPVAQRTRALSIAPLNGIEWLEGNNADLLPGTYTSPIVPFGLNQNAVSRNSGLRSIHTQIINTVIT